MISVLLPCHREGSLLARAIDSVRAQTLADWQLVVVCNNASDGTVAVAKQAAVSDRRILLVHEPTPGIAHALNTGLKYCTGDYVARLDADDAMPATRLEVQQRYLDQHSNVGLVSGQVRFVTETGTGYDHYVQQINSWRTHDEIFRYRFVESPFAHPSVMFRRQLIDQWGPYSTENLPEDYELWLRWAEAGVRFAKVDEVVLDWYDSAGRLSRTHENYRRRAFDDVRLRYLARAIPPLAAGRPVWVCGGRYARRKAARLNAAGVPITGIVDIIARRLDSFEAITYDQLPAPGGIFLVSMVSSRDGYQVVEKLLQEKGYHNQKDFILAA